MISALRGKLVSKAPMEVVIDVGGVGYSVNIPLSTFEVLGSINSEILVHTHLHVREDAVQLYGFATEEERNMFRLLISVNGIGPRVAQGILSGIDVADLKAYLAGGNAAALTRVPGVGRRLAERMVMELRDRILKVEPGAAAAAESLDPSSRARSEALLALTSLGYNRLIAEKALRTALQEQGDTVPSIEGLIKAALRHASRQ
jgi:Holliday junction DNA helicase RuvA